MTALKRVGNRHNAPYCNKVNAKINFVHISGVDVVRLCTLSSLTAIFLSLCNTKLDLHQHAGRKDESSRFMSLTGMIMYREVLAIIGSGEGDLRESKILDLFKKVPNLSLYDILHDDMLVLGLRLYPTSFMLGFFFV